MEGVKDPPPGKIQPRDLEAFCMEAMRRAGLGEEDARLTARVFVTTDSWGTFTHGSRQIRGLLRNARRGRLDLKAREEVVGEGPSWAIVDARDGMPPAISHRSMQRAIRKAGESGLGYVGIRRSSHYGAAGFYANMAAEQNMLGLSMCNVEPCMTAPGARARVLGTNPIAYAAPAGRERTVMLDIATSAVAATKIFAAKNEGRSIPGDWLVDEEGVPTTDPSRFPEEGAQLPMAGHKGYGLAVLVEILTATLTGAAMLSGVNSWAQDLADPSDQGHAFMAINLGAMMPIEEFHARMDAMIAEIKSAPRVRGVEKIYLPGEMEWERRDKALAEGMAMPEDVLMSLRGLAEDMDMDPAEYNLDLGG